jgi:hypothetical protein
MPKDTIFESEEEFYNDLRDEPCIVCGDPYQYVLGSYVPDKSKHLRNRKSEVPVLYYALCETCFNYGRIPTARIQAIYKNKFGQLAA